MVVGVLHPQKCAEGSKGPRQISSSGVSCRLAIGSHERNGNGVPGPGTIPSVAEYEASATNPWLSPFVREFRRQRWDLAEFRNYLLGRFFSLWLQ